MSDLAETNQGENGSIKKRKNARMLVLVLAIITSPLICCGSIYLLDALPNSPMPKLFEGEVIVENGSDETFYLTAITTTYGYPRVIPQGSSLRQRDIPILPDQSIRLTYDSADMPLDGIAVCRDNEDCRLMAKSGYSDPFYLDSFESLPKLDQDWFQAIQIHPRHNFFLILIPAIGLVPIALFAWWLYLGQKIKQEADNLL